MYENYRGEFPEVRGISVEELERLAEAEEMVLVDVRTGEEQQVSMLPGAITSEQFRANRERYRKSVVVTYCTIGARSGSYAAELLHEGFDVRNLEGSILAWTHAGGDLVSPNGPTRQVHVYGRRWHLAAEGYEAVW
ncbi:MAG: rhodanese-like domain-containing protein [Bryobacterales bacterium]|nr:rhodanese-like domain-containing protein [Acidobacteriota bacterium]MCB9383948.1 rhodanese-like domain-containing protein [Bryobacterales bacterium]